MPRLRIGQVRFIWRPRSARDQPRAGTEDSRDTGAVTNRQPTARARWWRLLLAAVAAALAVLLGAGTASATTHSLGRAVSAVGAKLTDPISNVFGRAAEAGEGAASNAIAEGSGGASKLPCLLGHSFTPETKVVLASGAAVAISSLKVGDQVRSVDPATGKSHVRKITKVLVNHDNDLVDVVVMRGGKRSVVHTTAGHPFWSETRHDWVRADELGTRDRVRSGRGSAESVRVARIAAVAGDEDRWDLTVQTDHDYYILTGAGSILVHNCGAANSAIGASKALELSRWPANDGFLHEPVETILKAGTRVDRFGGDAGRFTAPVGTPLPQRAMRLGSEKAPYSVFELQQDITVRGGITAPAFGQAGGGVQYLFPESMSSLLESGAVRRVP